MREENQERRFEDYVLTATSGPVWISWERGVPFQDTLTTDPAWTEISHSGRESQYVDFERAAERLVRDGLLEPRQPGACGSLYRFTKRGIIARWAVLENIYRPRGGL